MNFSFLLFSLQFLKFFTIVHFNFDLVAAQRVRIDVTKWWNDEEADNGPGLQFLKLHSSTFGETDKFSASNALEPAFCDAMDVDDLGYPYVPKPNYWLSSSDTENFMELDLGCLLEIQTVKIRNTHNSAFSIITTKKLKVELTKWNDNSLNVLYDADVNAVNTMVNILMN